MEGIVKPPIEPLPVKPIELSPDMPAQLRRVDDNTIQMLRVVEEKIDRGALEIEARGIEEQLDRVLSDEELLAWARVNYPWQNVDITRLRARLDEINVMLEIK